MASTPKWAHDLVCWQLGGFCRSAAAYSSTLLTIPEIPCIRWTGHVAAPDCRRNTTICRGSQFRRAVLVRSYAWHTGCKTLCRMCRIEWSPLLDRTIGTPSQSHLCPDASHHKGLTTDFNNVKVRSRDVFNECVILAKSERAPWWRDCWRETFCITCKFQLPVADDCSYRTWWLLCHNLYTWRMVQLR